MGECTVHFAQCAVQGTGVVSVSEREKLERGGPWLKEDKWKRSFLGSFVRWACCAGLFCLGCSIVGPVRNIFPSPYIFQFLFPHNPCSKLSRQPCWVTCLLVCVSDLKTDKNTLRIQRWHFWTVYVFGLDSNLCFLHSLLSEWRWINYQVSSRRSDFLLLFYIAYLTIFFVPGPSAMWQNFVWITQQSTLAGHLIERKSPAQMAMPSFGTLSSSIRRQ